jgi:hypothetical protein
MAKAADNNLKRSYNHKRGQANRNIAGQAMALLQGPSNLLVEFNHQYAIKVAEEDEFQATVGDMTTKRGFSIFQDINDISPGTLHLAVPLSFAYKIQVALRAPSRTTGKNVLSAHL